MLSQSVSFLKEICIPSEKANCRMEVGDRMIVETP